MPTDAPLVRDWLKALGTLCAGNQPVAEVRARVDASTALLRQDFDAWAFAPASLAHVARGAKFFPSYAELHAALAEWAKDNRPQTKPALDAPGDTGEDDDETEAYVALFRNRAAALGPAKIPFLLGIAHHYPQRAQQRIRAEFA